MTEEALKQDKKVSFVEEKRFSISDISETVVDPFCDENNPRIISFQDVCQAGDFNKIGLKKMINIIFKKLSSSFYDPWWHRSYPVHRMYIVYGYKRNDLCENLQNTLKCFYHLLNLRFG